MVQELVWATTAGVLYGRAFREVLVLYLTPSFERSRARYIIVATFPRAPLLPSQGVTGNVAGARALEGRREVQDQHLLLREGNTRGGALTPRSQSTGRLPLN